MHCTRSKLWRKCGCKHNGMWKIDLVYKSAENLQQNRNWTSIWNDHWFIRACRAATLQVLFNKAWIELHRKSDKPSATTTFWNHKHQPNSRFPDDLDIILSGEKFICLKRRESIYEWSAHARARRRSGRRTGATSAPAAATAWESQAASSETSTHSDRHLYRREILTKQSMRCCISSQIKSYAFQTRRLGMLFQAVLSTSIARNLLEVAKGFQIY